MFKADSEGRDETEGAGSEETLEDVTAGDHDLRDADQGDLVAGNATGSDQKELGKETGLDDVATSAPLRRTQCTFVIPIPNLKICFVILVC